MYLASSGDIAKLFGNTLKPLKVAVMNKQCTKCKVEKPPTAFAKNGEGLRSQCKECRCIIAKEYREANIEKMRQKDKDYYQSNKNEVLAKAQEYRKKNRDAICSQKKEYYNANKDKITEYHKNHKEQRNIQKKIHRQNNPIVGVVESLKVRIHRVLKSTKTDKCWQYIGCNKPFLQEWIESQFDDKMSWDNYGKYWHLDHVIAINLFDMTSQENRKVCFHWTNLRPLEKTENMSKSDKFKIEDILKHRQTVQNFVHNTDRYQAISEKVWWLRLELRYGKNPEDDFVKWFTNEMGNPQPSS